MWVVYMFAKKCAGFGLGMLGWINSNHRTPRSTDTNFSNTSSTTRLFPTALFVALASSAYCPSVVSWKRQSAAWCLTFAHDIKNKFIYAQGHRYSFPDASSRYNIQPSVCDPSWFWTRLLTCMASIAVGLGWLQNNLYGWTQRGIPRRWVTLTNSQLTFLVQLAVLKEERNQRNFPSRMRLLRTYIFIVERAALKT